MGIASAYLFGLVGAGVGIRLLWPRKRVPARRDEAWRAARARAASGRSPSR